MKRITFDAVVLSGGRGARLGGVSKARLLVPPSDPADGSAPAPLLLRAIRAVGDARRIVVVGDDAPGLAHSVLVVREEPPFGGPAAGLVAGLNALEPGEGWVLVIACDMPDVERAVAALLAAMPSEPEVDGVLLRDEAGHAQYLAGAYRRSALTRALHAVDSSGIRGLAMRVLVEPLRLHEVPAPPGATADIDVPADAARWGAREG